MYSKIAYVEFYVANGEQSAHFYKNTFGFSIANHQEQEKQNSYLLQQEDINLILSSASVDDHHITQHVQIHGDGVKNIAFWVDDVTEAYETALLKGATPLLEPTLLQDVFGPHIKATIHGYGNLTFSFVSFDQKNNPLFFQKNKSPIGLFSIDHFAVAVEPGGLQAFQHFFEQILNYSILYQQKVKTNYSGMNSVVMSSKCGNAKFTLVEPSDGVHESQITKFLRFNMGPGVQHVAFATKDIVNALQLIRTNGLELLHIPDSYYQNLSDKLPLSSDDLAKFKQAQILIDEEHGGLLMQVFSKPLGNRPTFFAEIIERQGAKGFGEGNVNALFQAIEQEQLSLNRRNEGVGVEISSIT